MTRGRTFSLLAGLYVSQFLGVGFFYTALVAILRDRGASLESLAAIQALGLVWAVKFLWAPLLDRYGSRRRGHYRGWLLVLQPAIVVGLLAMIGIDPVADRGALLLLAGLVVALSATQDIAADALAVRVLDVADRGVGNGIQVAGGYLGNILGGGAVLLVYDGFGWAAALGTLAALTAVPVVQVVRYHEPARPVPDESAPRPGMRALWSVFRAPGVARWTFVLLPLLWIGVSSAHALTTPMLVDAGWSLTRIGVLTTIVAGSLAVVAGAGSGAVVRRFGRRRALLGFGAGQVLAIVALLPLANGNGAVLVAAGAVCLLNVAYAAMATVVYTVNMDLCRVESPGTDYTLLSSFAFAASLIAGALALGVAGQVGYPAVVIGAAGLVVVALLVAARIFADTARSPKPDPAATEEAVT